MLVTSLILSVTTALPVCTVRQLGCYVDTPSHHALHGPDISLAGSNEDCSAACFALPRNYSFGGSKPKHCICGTSGPDGPPSGNPAACSTHCSGNVTEKCGGHEAVTVFSFKCSGDPPPSPSPSPSPPPPRPRPPSPPPGPLPWFPFRNTSWSLSARVADLVSRLTLDEKVANLVTEAAGVDRLGLASYYYDQECNSGIGVSFPQNIGMAATFNRTLLFGAGRGIGTMLRARANALPSASFLKGKQRGSLNCWSPMINIMRHPLWGRNHEGFGEDPYMSGVFAKEIITGMQGKGLPGSPKYAMILAGAKHFSMFDGPKNGGDAVITEEDWFWNYTPQFEAAVVEGQTYSVMCTYAKSNISTTRVSLRGLQSSARMVATLEYNSADSMVTRYDIPEADSVRQGYVVSDCGAVHNATASIDAGCDLECPFGAQQNAQFNKLGNLSRSGVVAEATIDTALSRLLGARFKLGEFDPPESVPFKDASVYNTAALTPPLQDLALSAARQSLVMLKNEHGTLPQQAESTHHTPAGGAGAGAGAFAVVGIENYMDAGYDTAGQSDVLASSALEMHGGFTVATAAGCVDGPACTMYNATAVKAAVSDADSVLVFMGSGGVSEREMLDQVSLEFRGNQTALLADAIAGAPPAAAIIVVLLTCTPLNITGMIADSRVGAVIQAFYPQASGGIAIVDAILGRCSSTNSCFGRLPYTWPRDLSYAGDLDNYTMLGTRKTFRYGEPDPLFPFGYGLDYGGPYTSSNLRTLGIPRVVSMVGDHATSNRSSGVPSSGDSCIIGVCDQVSLTVTVSNNSTQHSGVEVLQVYLRWLNPPVLTPTLQLVQFQRVELEAGEVKDVVLLVEPRQMAVLLPAASMAKSQPEGAANERSDSGTARKELPGEKKEREEAELPDWWIVGGLEFQLFVGGSQPEYGDVVSVTVQLTGNSTKAVRASECVG